MGKISYFYVAYEKRTYYPGAKVQHFCIITSRKNQKRNLRTYRTRQIFLSRELRRNCDRRSGLYNPDLAHRKYKKRLKEKPKHICFTDEVKSFVINKLEEDWSPEQIAGRAKLDGINCVSHERIYQFVWNDKRSCGTLHKHLRNKGKKYRKRSSYKSTRGIIKERVSIHDRPPEVDEKARFGDIEIDTIVGKGNKGAIFTATDRLTMMEWMVKLNGKNAAELADAIIPKLMPVKHLLHTLTSDNGKEFADHKRISEDLEAGFYFADPYKSCQRGLNENHNRLIRQYIPKKTDFETIDNKQIEYIQNKLNNIPRKKLNFLTPNENFLLYLQTQKVALVT